MKAEGFLEALSAEDREALLAAGMRRAYGANVTLFHQGDDAGAVIVLFNGRVKIANTSAAGREAIVAVNGPGDLIGELAAIDDGPRSTTVTTLEPVDVLLVPRAAFSAFLERSPRAALVISCAA